MSEVYTGEGLVTINNPGNSKIEIEMSGNEKQATRDGKNLYNVYDTEGRNFNSTLLKIDDEDKISLEDYTNSSDTTKWIDFNTNISSKIKASTVYYVVTEIFSVSGSGNLTVVSTNATAPGQFTTSVSYNFSALAAGDVKIAQITSREDLSNCVSMLRSFLQFTSGQSGSIEFRVSVLENSVTAEDFKYEKYGESPSFYYPSEVRTVENSINFKICNKNFLDIQKNATVEKGGVTVTTDENGVLTLNGTTTTNIYIKLNGKDIVDNNIPNWKKSCFRKGTYKFTSEVLTTTQAGNINAFLRKDVYETEGQYATLYQLMNAKTKTATANILEDTEAVVYLWIASGITLNNAKLKFQIELDNATDIVVHEEQFFVLPVQQKMLSGDKFIKVNGKWKEMHTWLELFFDGVNRKFNQEATNTSGKYRLLYHISEKVKDCDTTNGTKAYCSNSKLTAKGATYSCNEGFTVANNIIYIYIDGRTASAINAELQDNQITFYIPLKEDDYKYLDCTPEQINILNQIENIELYEGINNITATSSIDPNLQVTVKKLVEDYNIYISEKGHLMIPEYNIDYLIDANESNIPIMPEATESSVRAAGRDGDIVLNTTYEPIPFDIVCYTEDNLTQTEKLNAEKNINKFLNSIKNKTINIAFENNNTFYKVKYSGALVTTNYPKHLKFAIPLKSSDSYGKDLIQKSIVGNNTEESDTIEDVGALFIIRGPALNPIISLNDYSMEYTTSILEGASVEIDTSKSTITNVNNDGIRTNVMKYYNHQFPKIQNGINTLKILSGIDNDKNVIVTWNDLKL